MREFLPVLLGSDINAYGMARAFHERYGIRSVAFAHFQLSPTKFTRIVDVHIVPGFGESGTFLSTLLEYGRSMRQRHPDMVLLLIPCGDLYANLISQNDNTLRRYYTYNTLSPQLSHQLSYKNTFYELCGEHDLPYPKTKVVSKEGVMRGEHTDLPFPYPVAMKPVDSVAWLKIDFPGRKKAFIIDNPEELDTLIRRSYEAGYQGDMVIQDFVPGDDSRMRVLNAYVDRHHRVRMMMLGHPLLEDPTPEAVGNYAAIIPDWNESVFARVKSFLESIGYEGVANFDMKYDERDGEYKLFEINLRQGRSSYFVTLNGHNLAACFVDDLVEDTPFDGGTLFARGDRLWLQVPRGVFRDYAAPGSDRNQALAMLREGRWGSTLRYRKDRSVRRWLMLRHMDAIYTKRYARFFRRKADMG